MKAKYLPKRLQRNKKIVSVKALPYNVFIGPADYVMLWFDRFMPWVCMVTVVQVLEIETMLWTKWTSSVGPWARHLE